MYNIPGLTGIAGMCILNMNLPKFIRGYSGDIKSISLQYRRSFEAEVVLNDEVL
jgi:hypothetical protein